MRNGTLLAVGLAMLVFATSGVRAGEESFESTLSDWPVAEGPARVVDVHSWESEPVPDSSNGKPAEDAENEAAPTGWAFELSIFLWAPSLSTENTIDGHTVDLDLSFSDLLDDFLEGAFGARLESWHGDFGIIFNYGWVSLGESLELTGPGRFGINLDMDLAVEQMDVLLAAAWRFAGDPVGTHPKRAGFFGDFIGGLRYGLLDQSVEVEGLLDLSGSEDWIEPVIGLRAGYCFGPVFTLSARMEAGGFGFGDMPDEDLLFLIDGQFRVTEWLDIRLGYQWRRFVYSTGSGSDEFGMKANYGGPRLALTFRF